MQLSIIAMTPTPAEVIAAALRRMNDHNKPIELPCAGPPAQDSARGWCREHRAQQCGVSRHRWRRGCRRRSCWLRWSPDLPGLINLLPAFLQNGPQKEMLRRLCKGRSPVLPERRSAPGGMT